MTIKQLSAAAETYLSRTRDDATARLPSLHVMRKEQTGPFEAVIYDPVICLILRGEKVVSVGAQTVRIGAGDALLVSHDLPVVSQVTRASPGAPYLAVILSLDLGIIRGYYEQIGESVTVAPDARSLSVCAADPAWTEPLGRYIALTDNPLEARVIGPLILREIHARLLLSPIGAMLRNLLSVGSHASRIARAILRIRNAYTSPLAVGDLASLAGMSQSSFHEHFKSVTGTTPLQYQKDLRMIEAQRLLQEGGQPVSAVAYAVGYESPTQFSREYSRKFGAPPSRVSDAAVPA